MNPLPSANADEFDDANGVDQLRQGYNNWKDAQLKPLRLTNDALMLMSVDEVNKYFEYQKERQSRADQLARYKNLLEAAELQAQSDRESTFSYKAQAAWEKIVDLKDSLHFDIPKPDWDAFWSGKTPEPLKELEDFDNSVPKKKDAIVIPKKDKSK